MTRRKFTAKFKTKIVLEALKEQETTNELSQRYDVAPQQITSWKREFLQKAEDVFTKVPKSKKSEAEEKEERLLKTIGQQKVELDFLKKALS